MTQPQQPHMKQSTVIYVLGDNSNEPGGATAWILVVNGQLHSMSQTHEAAETARRLVTGPL